MLGIPRQRGSRPFTGLRSGYAVGMTSNPGSDPADHDPATEPTTEDATAQGTEAAGTPIDPAAASSSPDPGQTQRDRRHG